MTDEEREAILNQINDLTIRLSTLKENLNVIVERIKELDNFSKAFNNQFEQCQTNFDNLGKNIGSINIPSLSDDNSLSGLRGINDSIGETAMSAFNNEDVAAIKNNIDSISNKSKDDLLLDKTNIQKEIDSINEQISALQSQLG